MRRIVLGTALVAFLTASVCVSRRVLADESAPLAEDQAAVAGSAGEPAAADAPEPAPWLEYTNPWYAEPSEDSPERGQRRPDDRDGSTTSSQDAPSESRDSPRSPGYSSRDRIGRQAPLPLPFMLYDGEFPASSAVNEPPPVSPAPPPSGEGPPESGEPETKRAEPSKLPPMQATAEAPPGELELAAADEPSTDALPAADDLSTPTEQATEASTETLAAEAPPSTQTLPAEQPAPSPPESVDVDLQPEAVYGPENPRQVRLEARVLEWTHNTQTDWGFSVLYSALNDEGQVAGNSIVETADATFPSLGGVNQGVTLFLDQLSGGSDEGAFEVVIQALEKYGDVTVLSQPSIVVMNKGDTGAESESQTVSVKDEVGYESVQVAGSTVVQTTEFKEMGKTMTIEILDIYDNLVKIHVQASITNLNGYVSVAVNNQGDPMLAPQTDTRSMDSYLLVPDGQLMIGGVLKTTTHFRREQGVPWLARIPLIGYLFKNRELRKADQELLFLVRPEIIRN